MPNPERDPKEPGDIAAGGAAEFQCPDCGQAFKTAQGLAVLRRLAHSTSTFSELDARETKTVEREAAVKRREAELSRQVGAARRADAALRRREEALRGAEAVPERERIGTTAAREIAQLPEFRLGAILRVTGVDYRLTESGLVHVYFPSGEKTKIALGSWFRFNARAYRVQDGRLSADSTADVLGRFLGEED
jgi:hypothetical protein